MADCQTDPAIEVIETVTAALAALFNPTAQCPPRGGGSTSVRFFAGDGAPLAAWDSHATQGCEEPFLWVRVMRRYRSQSFPAPTIDSSPCDLLEVLPVEIGVGRCAVVDQEPSWDDYAEEAAVSLDDSWRISKALCTAAKTLRHDDANRLVGVDTLMPYGPEGGVIAWTGILYASY